MWRARLLGVSGIDWGGGAATFAAPMAGTPPRHDGMGWDGMGWDGMGWDGMGWDGMGWDGMGWDGMGRDGMGWDGMEDRAVEEVRVLGRLGYNKI